MCTFPAYTETNVSARRQDFEQILKRKNEAWKNTMRTKLKGDSGNGIEGTDVTEKN